jgi:23S rRNA (adenine2503-C2)-methyltransferase
MEERLDIKNLSKNELRTLITQLGKEDYRVRQIIHWVYHHRVDSFQKMTNISRKLRDFLQTTCRIDPLTLIHLVTSRDGSQKYLFSLDDDQSIESVLIPEEGRLTLCVSTQVGCSLGCQFCLTGRMGFSRDLSTSEIVGQILAVQNLIPTRELTNIVLMGMGEPLANFENTVKALEIMRYEHGLRFSKRKITLSTAGLVPGIDRLGRSLQLCRLAISLNATEDVTRSALMPINRRYSLEDLLDACRRFPLAPRDRITFEYVLIKGVNDSGDDAVRLPGLLRGIRAKVNLIPYNPSSKLPFDRPEEKDILTFQQALLRKNITAIIRKSRGTDISAACGQLMGQARGRNAGSFTSREALVRDRPGKSDRSAIDGKSTLP